MSHQDLRGTAYDPFTYGAYDPFTYGDSFGGFGAAFCRGVEPFLANLKALINEADRLGVGDWPAAASAKAVYEDIDGFILYTPWGGADGDCARHTREVQAAIETISALLRATPGASLAVPRPDAETQSTDGPFPTWVKFAAFGVMGVMTLGYLAPVIAALVRPKRKLSGYRRRRR